MFIVEGYMVKGGNIGEEHEVVWNWWNNMAMQTCWQNWKTMFSISKLTMYFTSKIGGCPICTHNKKWNPWLWYFIINMSKLNHVVVWNGHIKHWYVKYLDN